MTPVDFVYNRKKAFQRAFELVRAHLNHNQKRRNALYNQNILGPKYETDQKVLLHNLAFSVDQTSKLSSPWRGPYIILDCLNDVTYKIRQLTTNTESVVHYDRLKPFFETPDSFNVPTRATRDPAPQPLNSNVPTRSVNNSEPSPDYRDHSACCYFQQIPMAFSMPSVSPTTPTVPRTSRTPHSPKAPITRSAASPVPTATTDPQASPSTPITTPLLPFPLLLRLLLCHRALSILALLLNEQRITYGVLLATPTISGLAYVTNDWHTHFMKPQFQTI